MKSNDSYHVTSRRCVFLAVLLVAIIAIGSALPALAQEHPNQARGHAPGKTVSMDGPDSVNLFNGNLGINVPIGGSYPVGDGFRYQVSLRYNSAIWDVHTTEGAECQDQAGPPCTIARPSEYFNAGVGWKVTFGELFHPLHHFNTSDSYLYVDQTGARHHGYWTLHEGEEATPGFGYTRDGSYLRGNLSSDTNFYIEFPNGTKHTFGNRPEDHRWRATRIEDKFGNWLSIDYGEPACAADSDCWNDWTLTDSVGRVHTLSFFSPAPNTSPGEGMRAGAAMDRDWDLRTVRMASPGSGYADYDLSFADAEVHRSCKDQSGFDDLIPVRFLEEIAFPDGTSMVMTYNHSDNMSAPICHPDVEEIDDLPGTMKSLRLPTGALTEYEYQEFEYPTGNSHCGEGGFDPTDPHQSWLKSYANSTGIAARKLSVSGAPVGEWTYVAELLPEDGYIYAPNVKRTVISPEGDATVHYFRTDVDLCDPAQGEWTGWDYGLPYTNDEDLGDALSGAFLSKQIYEGSVDIGTLVRSVYVKYEHDVLPPVGYDPRTASRPWYENNQRLVFSKTVFEDDYNPAVGANTYSEVEFSDFDGMGHYRRSRTDGNFDNDNVRTSITGYNPAADGSYPLFEVNAQGNGYGSNHTFSPWTAGGADEDSWITYTHDKKEQWKDDPGTTGYSVARQLFDFDRETGFLNATRILRNDPQGNPDYPLSFDDLLILFSREENGVVGDGSSALWTKWYGGDDADNWIPNLNETPFDPGTAAAAHVVRDTMEYGVLRESQQFYIEAGTSNPPEPADFLLVDRDIDFNTGFVVGERDSAGFATTYEFDDSGRPSKVIPAEGARTEIDYHNPVIDQSNVVTATAWTEVSVLPFGGVGQPLGGHITRYDGFGRQVRQCHLMLDGTWGQRNTAYNDMGWVVRVSEIAADGSPECTTDTGLSPGTALSFHDAFGRARYIVPPGGEDHTVFLQFAGQRRKSTTVKIGELAAPSTTTETYDRHGRLYKVEEPSGTDSSIAPTVYEYDVGGRLSSAVTTPVGYPSQSRTFVHNNLGFMTEEILPEYGPGSAYYSYNAVGNLLNKQVGNTDLTFEYDFSSRLKRVLDSANGNAVLVHNTYCPDDDLPDACGGRSTGKLGQALRHNSGFDSADPTRDFIVEHNYHYTGLGGTVSSVTTRAGIAGESVGTFTTGYSWNAFGDLDTVSYPLLDQPASEPSRTVSYSYQRGWLKTISQTGSHTFVGGITYHPNGLYSQISHGNGVVAHQTVNSHGVARPESLYTTGAWLGSEDGDWTSGTISYDGAGNIVTMDYGIGDDGPRAVHYEYDKVGRLMSYEDRFGAGPYKDSAMYLGYDPYGNQRSYSGFWTHHNPKTGGGYGVPFDWTIDADPTTNRLTNESYDNAGNQLSLGDAALAYTPFGELLSATGPDRRAVHGYDASGERIGQWDSGAPGGAALIYSIRDLGGQVLRQFKWSYQNNSWGWSWVKDYVYRGAVPVTSIEPAGATEDVRHLHLDHLGTPRIITDASAHVVGGNTLFPFGREIGPADDDAEKKIFTGHERDSFSLFPDTVYDVDYMHARYYSPSNHRFLSIDPVGGMPVSPQTWNRYAYVQNNPIKYVDPYGLYGHMVYDCRTDPNGCQYEGDLFRYPSWVVEMHYDSVYRQDRFEFAWPTPVPSSIGDQWAYQPTQFVAGMADELLLGLGDDLRRVFHGSDVVDTDTGVYRGGKVTGFVASLSIGFVNGVRAAGVKAAGLEFSHWIPARYLKNKPNWLKNTFGRSIFNGNYVTPRFHALSDPYRYRFMPRIWKGANPMLPLAFQQAMRIPFLYSGGAAGAAWGGVGIWNE